MISPFKLKGSSSRLKLDLENKYEFAEACHLLSISTKAMTRLIEQNLIPVEKEGDKYLFSESALLEYKEKLTASSQQGKTWEIKGDFSTEGLKRMAKRTFQELASNIEELIVNAYDADATSVQVSLDLDKNTLTLIDDGSGMDDKTLSSYVIYGESAKNSKYQSPKFSRSPIGEYGMGGKLAISNIASRCKIVTRKNGIEHTFSMDKAQLDTAKYLSEVKRPVFTQPCDPSLHGTTIIMEQLFYKTIDVQRLVERFSTKMPKSQNFKITFNVIEKGKTTEMEIKEPVFPYTEKFDFSANLPLIGEVTLTVFFAKEPIPATKQGIWTKVNGRIVNEKQEWFGLLNLTSGQRYRWRLYGFSEANGLKDFINFSKNDFVDSPEYKEYYGFVHKCLENVQKTLLQKDETLKKDKERDTVKSVEHEVNEVVKHLDYFDINGVYDTVKVVTKVRTSNLKDAPAFRYPDLVDQDKIEGGKGGSQKRTEDKAPRRNRSLAEVDKLTPASQQYRLRTVDLSETGDLIYFDKKNNIIEVNEKHSLYLKAAKAGSLNEFIRNLAFGQIANDYTQGNQALYDKILNELMKLYVENEELLKQEGT